MSRVGTCQYPLNIVHFQFRAVVAAVQRNWSVFLQNLGHFRIVLRGKVISIFEFLPVLAAVL